jgi:HAD superfamily hydrolase (TIGR01509 family)
VLFDVDGTLIDTNYLHTLAWARAFGDAGEWAPMNAIHRLIGKDGDDLVVELLGHPSPRATEARPIRYKELLGDAEAFPGAAGLLRKCRANGLGVVLATSAQDDELVVLREMLDADDAIDAQTTASEVQHSKPSPEIFLKAMEKGSVDPERAVAIGDSVWDVEAARAAGIACIAVESGGFSEHELNEAGALHVYRHVEELSDQFRLSPLALLFR